MAAREKSAAKSPRKLGGRPFAKGGDPRQGRGPKKGEGGAPPSELRKRLRGSFSERVKILEAIADDTTSSAMDRMRAVDLLAKYGLGTTQEVTGKDGTPLNPHERVDRLKELLGIRA